jgi:hypothetical protein
MMMEKVLPEVDDNKTVEAVGNKKMPATRRCRQQQCV